MFRPAKLNRLCTKRSSLIFLLRPKVEEAIWSHVDCRTYSDCEVIWDHVWVQVEEAIAGPVAAQLRTR
jgi:hypothetical protein